MYTAELRGGLLSLAMPQAHFSNRIDIAIVLVSILYSTYYKKKIEQYHILIVKKSIRVC